MFFVSKKQKKLKKIFTLSYMDLTQYHKSTEFPMFCPSKSGSGGVENLLPSLVHLTTTSETIINRAFQRLKKCQVSLKTTHFWWFYTLYHITKISICLQTLINTRKIKGSIFLNKSNKSKIYSLSILRTLSTTIKPL